MNIFAKKPTPKEQVRASQRELRGNVRDLEREIQQLKREEAKLITDIKAAAKKGNTADTKVLAKSLVRLRAQITKLHGGAAQLKGVSAQMTTATATTTVATAMGNATKVMQQMGKTLDAKEVSKQMQQFALENQRMEMAQEVMDDTLSDALDADGMEEEADEVMNQVLDEIGVDISSKLQAAPQKKIGQTSKVATAEDAEADELLARLGALKQ